MEKNGKLGRNAALALAATILTTALVGCGSSLPSPGDSTGKSTNDTGRSVTPKQQREETPTTPKNDYGDDVPTNIPQPIPQPEQPSEPGKIGVRAVANTVTSNPLAAITSAAPNRISVYSTITWSKTEGAAQYRVSRREEGGDDKYYIRANVPASFRGYQDGGIMNLKIGIKYDYRVEALDSSGRVIAAGEDNSTPLYPVGLPAKKDLKPADGADEFGGSTPDFAWGEVKDAQGYYVEVFSSVTLLPMWRGYRENTHGTAITYGDQIDIMPGTIPAVWTQPLNPAGTYTWSVTAIKTDTGNAATAKAWAKSNTPAMRFYMGKKPVVGGK